MKKMTIGQLAKQIGISTVAIRHYERLGLLTQPERGSNGYRLYAEASLKRLRFITNAKLAGFNLEETRELLSIQDSEQGSSYQIKQQTLAKVKAIREKIIVLQQIADDLDHLAARCDGKIELNQCPILKSLYAESDE